MSSSRSAIACGAGYKTGAGIEPALLSQFALLEEAVAALGIVVWPMVEFEADDALAAARGRPVRTHGWSASSSARLTRTWRNRPRHARRAAEPPHARGHATKRV